MGASHFSRHVPGGISVYVKEADEFQERIAPIQKIIADNGRAYRAIPALRFDPEKVPGGIATLPFIKFDNSSKGATLVLNDAKWVGRPGNINRRRKAINRFKVALYAAQQNAEQGVNVKIVYKFPDQKSADAFQRHVDKIVSDDEDIKDLVRDYFSINVEAL